MGLVDDGYVFFCIGDAYVSLDPDEKAWPPRLAEAFPAREDTRGPHRGISDAGHARQVLVETFVRKQL